MISFETANALAARIVNGRAELAATIVNIPCNTGKAARNVYCSLFAEFGFRLSDLAMPVEIDGRFVQHRVGILQFAVFAATHLAEADIEVITTQLRRSIDRQSWVEGNARITTDDANVQKLMHPRFGKNVWIIDTGFDLYWEPH